MPTQNPAPLTIERVVTLQPLLCVSFPRSGCTWLAACLTAALPGFEYCELYSVPYRAGHHNFVKNHDFGLDYPLPPGLVPILQLREPIAAVCSYWTLSVERGVVEDTEAAFRDWAPAQFRYWKRLYARWRHRAVLTLWHDHLLLDPYSQIEAVARLMTGDPGWTMPREASFPAPRFPSRPAEFRYYDRDWLEQQWREAGV